MGHIDEERAARAGFDTVQSAQASVRQLGESIGTDGFPEGTIPDTARSDRMLVPFGENGYAGTRSQRTGTLSSKQSLLRGEMESEYGRRFWAIETLEEGQTVARLLRRRFPQVFESLSEIFEQADPLDIVYPGNPNEYSDVIREIIVLLAPVEGKIGLLTPGQVEELVKEGLGRCFDDEPIERRVQDVVRMITARFKVLLLSLRILMSRTERQGCKRSSPSSSRLVQLLMSAVLGSFSG